MPRINLDDEFFTDPRVKLLARKAHTTENMIRGMLVTIWHRCTVKGSAFVKRFDVEAASELDVPSICDLMIESELADATEDPKTIRLRGVEERIEWLVVRRAAAQKAGKKSAETRKNKYGSAQPHPNDSRTDVRENPERPEPNVREHDDQKTDNMTTTTHDDDVVVPNDSRTDVRTNPEHPRTDGQPNPNAPEPSYSCSYSRKNTNNNENKFSTHAQKMNSGDDDVVVGVLVSDDEPNHLPEPKRTRPKTKKEIPDAFVQLGTAWLEWAVAQTPHHAGHPTWTPHEFGAALFKAANRVSCDVTRMNMLFAFIRNDSFWSKNAVSPHSLTRFGTNGMLKIDNILSRMETDKNFKSKMVLFDILSNPENDKPVGPDYVGF